MKLSTLCALMLSLMISTITCAMNNSDAHGMSQSSPANGVTLDQFAKERESKLAASREQNNQTQMDTSKDASKKVEKNSAGKNAVSCDSLPTSELYGDSCAEYSLAEKLYEKFFTLVERGKVDEINEFFKNNTIELQYIDFDINCARQIEDVREYGNIDFKGKFTPSLGSKHQYLVDISETAYVIALKHGHKDMASFLAQKGADTNLDLKRYDNPRFQKVHQLRDRYRRKGQPFRKRFKGNNSDNNYGMA